MSNGIRNDYRASIRTDPKANLHYLWNIHGIENVFYKQSQVAYTSVEQAIAEAHARADQLT